MKIVETGRPHTLEMRGGGGVLTFVGLPFLLVGLTVWAFTFRIIPVKDGPPLFFGLPFGAIFALVGAGLMFGRRDCIIDTRSETISLWWGLLVPLRRDEKALGNFTRVTITKEIRRTDKSTYTVFPVRLDGADDQVALGEMQDYAKTRELAEQVAKFLELPLSDTSSGAEVVRESGALDEPLRDRLRRTGELPELPERPAAMKSRILKKDRAVMIELPPPKPNPLIALALGVSILPVIIVMIVVPHVMRDPPPAFIIVFFVIMALIGILLPAIVIKKKFIDVRSGGLDPHEHPVAFAQRLRDTIERHCRQSLKGLGMHRARVRRLILRAMDPDPAGRFESGAEMRDEILGLLRRSMPVAWPDTA